MMTSTNGKSPVSSETVLKSKRRHISVAEKIRILKAVKAAAPGHRASKAQFFVVKASIRRKCRRGDDSWNAAISIPRHCVNAFRSKTNRKPPTGVSPT